MRFVSLYLLIQHIVKNGLSSFHIEQVDFAYCNLKRLHSYFSPLMALCQLGSTPLPMTVPIHTNTYWLDKLRKMLMGLRTGMGWWKYGTAERSVHYRWCYCVLLQRNWYRFWFFKV